ncbi:hypothetical protein NW754_007833 [Fusarium falciforme]|nr:hypothetical protein NW754_007833 [Fusarium falciforme]
MGDNVNTGDLEWQDSGVSAGHNKAYYQAMHAFLKSELPTKQEALILAHTYIRWVHPDFPVLEPSSLFSAIDAIYSCVFESGQVDDSTHGWTSTMPPFRWNGRLVTPGVPEDHGATLPVIAFIIFMVFNIAAIVKVRTRVYEFPPQRLYAAAVHFSKDAFSQISLPTIQAMVMLINHSMLMPAEINLWTLVHLASAHCVELGIHREHHSERPEDFAMKQIRRFTFFTIYSLDRSISSIQGRPLGFRDETFDIQLPESPPPEDDAMNGAIPHSFMAAVTRLLTIGGEWWPSAKSGQRSFGSVADLTMRKLYMDDSPFKAPRLSQYSTTGGRSARRVEEPGIEDGTWQGISTTSDDDQGIWQGINMGRPDFVPEIEMFLADFDRSEFTWSFPLDANKDLDPFGTHPNPGF